MSSFTRPVTTQQASRCCFLFPIYIAIACIYLARFDITKSLRQECKSLNKVSLCVYVCVCVCVTMKRKRQTNGKHDKAIPATIQVSSSKHNAEKQKLLKKEKKIVREVALGDKPYL